MSPPQDKARKQITKLSKHQPDEMPTTKALTVRAHPLLEGAVAQERASVALLGRYQERDFLARRDSLERRIHGISSQDITPAQPQLVVPESLTTSPGRSGVNYDCTSESRYAGEVVRDHQSQKAKITISRKFIVLQYFFSGFG
eukprot:sb/3474069/